MPKTLAVNVRHVSKRFDQGTYVVEALKDVTFEVQTNEVLMVVGPSGCGKTTLLSVVAGTLSFDKGEIFVFGTPLHKLSTAEITAFRRVTVGFIFQQFHLIPTLNCIENISIPLLLENIPFKEAEERAAVMLEKMGLKGREYERPKNLSGGEQQRIAIARALVHNPKLVICDEPTSSLDAETGVRIMEILKDIVKDKDRAVIVVTHDSRILKYADRITKMNDGRIVEEKEEEEEDKGSQ